MDKKIILITGSTETLSYFSKQIGAYLSSCGMDVFYWDMQYPSASKELFFGLQDHKNWILVTFNFLGLCGEGQFAYELSNVWDVYGISKISIMVDSPIYYFRQLSEPIANLRLICIDKNHLRFVNHFFPEYINSVFMPLRGNFPIDDIWMRPGTANKNEYTGGVYKKSIYIKDYELKKIKDRHIDILFAGNYVTIDSIMPSIVNSAPEYKEFIMDTANDLINNPGLVLEDTLYNSLKKEFDDENEKLYPEAMFHMIFIDLYIRTYFRSRLIKNLADNGYVVHCIGHDWDKLKCEHPENVIHSNRMLNSIDCVNAMADSKISLNIMPWFKAGAHDRIFTAMLAGCVSVSDSSAYLDEVIVPWQDYAPFTLGEDESVTDTIQKLNNDIYLSQNIADCGRKRALDGFTWMDFAKDLINYIDDKNEC